jgi:hypothetical protein
MVAYPAPCPQSLIKSPKSEAPNGEQSASESDAKRECETGLAHENGHNSHPCGGFGLGGRGADAAALAAAPATAALPCQKSNNSTESGLPETAHRLTGGHSRTVFALEQNVRLLAETTMRTKGSWSWR